ncbi:MAG: glycosyltransferase family 9 protein [Bacteroidota bacterium]|nr:glycosyltransferase family 9 protein [Bacteroidota bacterium]
MKEISKNEVKNLLIARTDRLGDVILTLPLISAAKKVFNNAKVIFFVKKYTSDLIKSYEGIDELSVEEDVYGFWDKYKYFRNKKIDLVINVKPRFDLALLFYMLRIKYRIGTGYRWYSFFYNYKVYEHRKISDKHESDYNLNLLKIFFDEVDLEKEFHFKYSSDEKNKLDTKLNAHNLSLDESFIIIHPGSGSSAKDLSPEKFSEFINGIMNEYSNYKIIFTGLEKEKILTDKIKTGVNKVYQNKLIDVNGKVNLKDLMILIDHSKLFISNSTGPIHIAGALNKNIIGFYPNEKKMGNIRWGPLGKNVIVLMPDESNKMDSINVKNIMNAVRQFLNNNFGTIKT